MKRIYLLIVVLLCCVSSLAWAEIWGVKSHDPISQAPATLFKFNEDGTGFTTIAAITLDSIEIDVDGLVLSADDILYGFEVTGSNSRLITIDKTTAQATVIGSWLSGRDIRGATFDDQGQLITLDSNKDRYIIVRIDPATGNVRGATGLFDQSFGDFSITNMTDIVQRSDGAFVFTGPNPNSLWLYRNIGSKVYELFTDDTPAADGYVPAIAGLAISDSADSPEKLFLYDVSEDDDLYTYQMDDEYARETLFVDIIDSYNAGRGDLASRPITLRTNLVNNPSFEEGPASVGNHLHLPAGSTELTGWDITQGAIDIVGEWEHADGDRSLDLNGSPGVGEISQVINTIPGRMYRLRFKIAANTDVQPCVSRMMVQANDESTIQEFDNIGLGVWNMGWCTRVWYFDADETRLSLRLPAWMIRRPTTAPRWMLLN
jgi:choice-of-anchor C domain-containing protein